MRVIKICPDPRSGYTNGETSANELCSWLAKQVP